jgi:hypothetical protein
MSKNTKAARKATKLKRLLSPSIVPSQPKIMCPICSRPMKLKRLIPAVDLSHKFLPVFPELKTFECNACGNLRTVEQSTAAVAA